MTKMKHHILVAFLMAVSLCVTVWSRASEDTQTAAQTAAQTATYNEANMPLNLSAAKVSEKTETSQAKTVLGLVMVLVVLGGVYWFVKKYANNKMPQTSLMQIKVIAQQYLGPKKSIAVIRVAGESMVIGITDNQINLIKSLAVLDDDYSAVARQQESTAVEQTITDEVIEKDSITEDFSFADLKSTVSNKIKSMRSFQ